MYGIKCVIVDSGYHRSAVIVLVIERNFCYMITECTSTAAGQAMSELLNFCRKNSGNFRKDKKKFPEIFHWKFPNSQP